MCRLNHAGNAAIGLLIAALVFLPIPYAAQWATQELGLPVVPVREVLWRLIPLIVGLALGRKSFVATIAALIGAVVVIDAQVTLVYEIRLSRAEYFQWVGMALGPFALGAALGIYSACRKARIRLRQSSAN